MQAVFVLVTLLLALVVLSAPPALDFKTAYASARLVWVPIIAVLSVIGLGAWIIFSLAPFPRRKVVCRKSLPWPLCFWS
jgi:hypothetical protein